VSYNYTKPDGVQMQEYHLDTHKTLDDFVSANNKQHGGDLRVRLCVGECPFLLVGQDKRTSHQYIFSKKQSNGEAFLMPKSEGEIYMASGFTARDFRLGLGLQLMLAISNEINESRKQNNPTC
jgi:hypothetical protein